MKKMNLPNKLTLLRILLVPAVIAVILIDFPFHFTVAGVLFGIAAITDALDGKIARRDNLITDFGKFAAIPLIIIIFREFTVTSVRLVAAAKGKVIAANMWGKVKTVTQIVAIVAIFLMQTTMDIISLSLIGKVLPMSEYNVVKIMLNSNSLYYDLFNIYNIFNIIGQVLLWIVAVITVISGVKYLVDNKEVISDM